MTAKVTTFYSYKGGSGRSMTLANVAWALATNQERVLVIDWDLEAPGLHRYFHPFLSDPEQRKSRGLIDRVWEYLDELSDDGKERTSRFSLADCRDLVQPLDIPGTSKGCLHFIGAGRQDDHYSAKVVGLDWNGFYLRFDGEAFINAIISWAKRNYTHILIDSRTGVADTAGICTTQLPDMLVMCLVYNRQSIDGSASVARSILQGRSDRQTNDLKVEFVPCRVEDRSTVEAARRYTALRLGHAVNGERHRIERNLRRAEIRHYPWCAFEEKLAVFEELPDDRGSLLEVVHDLAARVSGEQKKLRIRHYEREVLDSYWSRVAFDDPRLLELRSLPDETLEEAWPRLELWLREASDAEDLRPDWLMDLAETALDFINRRGSKLSREQRDLAQVAAEGSARKAWLQDRDSYGPRLSQVLYARAGHLLRADQLTPAAAVTREAILLLESEKSSTLLWRRARAIERLGDILSAASDNAGALESYRQAIRFYQGATRRTLPVGAEHDLPRVMRLAAGELAALGEWNHANAMIIDSARQLLVVPEGAIERDASEAVRILKARLRLGSKAENSSFNDTMHWVSAAAHKLLAPTALREIELELVVIQADRLISDMRWQEALAVLDALPEEFRWETTVVMLQLQTLLASGRARDAMDHLRLAVVEHGLQLTPEMLQLALQIFEALDDIPGLADLVAQWLRTDESEKDGLIAPLLRNILSHSADSRDIDYRMFLGLIEILTRRRD